ncbi:zona pellucida sperm-binding protein 3d.2 [Cololabis saira]|uniref:zona pellucida sperm-binding protein 3d.2 n=1 Tax=Cololabis saira TaxID=129043 RepID=UPI002AD277D1|nr:zona pellucida sperm-binding protein 3d.2 [Cololabis saira]
MVCLLLLVLLSSAAGGTLTAEDSSPTLPVMRRVDRRETPVVFVKSYSPLVEKEFHYSVRGPAAAPPPKPVRELLLPVWPNISPASIPGVAVATVCEDQKLRLQVDRSIVGPDGPPSLLRLGTCRPSRSTTEHLYFDYDLGLCGTEHTVIDNKLVYYNILHYDPPRPPGPIRRALPFSLPVACYSDRYLFSYKVGFTPKVQMRKGFKEMRNFILTPRNARWEQLSPSDQYGPWEPVRFQAEAPALPRHQRLYVHTCYVSAGTSHTATPQFAVVKNFGCAVGNEDTRAAFIPYRNNAVRFSVEAGAFRAAEGQLYMHCSVAVGGSIPTPTAKSCSYDTQAKRWGELLGSDSVCDCCDSICSFSAPPAQMVSSEPWTVEPRVKPTPSPRRRTGSVTAAAAAPEMMRWRSWPEETVGEREWPFGGRGLTWVEEEREEKQVEEEREEKQVKGSAYVEVEEEGFTEPRRTFEDIFVFDK